MQAYGIYLKKSSQPLPLLIADLKEEIIDEYLNREGLQEIKKMLYHPGYIPNTELPAVYSGASVFIYTSLRESFGIPILEAMACGTPVITSTTSAMPEIAGPEGILVNPFEPEEIASALLHLEENAESQNEKSRKVKYEKTASKNIECKNTASKNAEYKNSRITAIVLIITIMLMACIFSTLDNIVTYYHSKGIMDIGQYPRLLLAISGVVAGVLFDLKERKLMCLIMYSVTLLSTICMLVITMGEPFIIGLVVFYLSAGFFSVFFTTAFVNLSFEMKTPELWAGMGRATNNLCAALMGTVFFSLFNSTNMLSNSIVIIILFVFSNAFLWQFNYGKKFEKKLRWGKLESDDNKMENFVQQFSLSKRECEVLETLLKSDKNVKEIAQELYISRAALYRHISNMNEKTDTKSREGLIKFYYQWEKSGKN